MWVETAGTFRFKIFFISTKFCQIFLQVFEVPKLSIKFLSKLIWQSLVLAFDKLNISKIYDLKIISCLEKKKKWIKKN